MATKQNTNYKRYPWLACSLSLLMPGLGQLYCGAIIKCLCLSGLMTLFGMLSILALVPEFQMSDKLVMVFQAFSLLVYGVGVVDAYLSARRMQGDYQRKDYNHWFAYILFYFVASGGYVSSSLFVRDNLLQAFKVPAASMYPAIWPGDHLLAAKNAYLTRNPEVGDIVIFRNPDNRRIFFLKRVVALAGDSVEIRDGDLYINDVKLKREAVASPAVAPAQVTEGKYFEESNGNAKYEILLSANAVPGIGQFPKTVVPKNCCFVLGDNRNTSLDSRNFGAIPIVGIIGKASFIYSPAGIWSRFGAIR